MWKIGSHNTIGLMQGLVHVNAGISPIACFCHCIADIFLFLFSFGQPAAFFMRVDDAYGL